MEKDASNEGSLKLNALKEFWHHCREKIIKNSYTTFELFEKNKKKRFFHSYNVCIAFFVCCINARTESCVF